jgi:hypothetical protein
MSNAANDVRAADEAARRVTLHAEDHGVAVTGASTPDPDRALIPWGQAVAVARRIIELARARGDISWGPRGCTDIVACHRPRRADPTMLPI